MNQGLLRSSPARLALLVVACALGLAAFYLTWFRSGGGIGWTSLRMDFALLSHTHESLWREDRFRYALLKHHDWVLQITGLTSVVLITMASVMLGVSAVGDPEHRVVRAAPTATRYTLVIATITLLVFRHHTSEYRIYLGTGSLLFVVAAPAGLLLQRGIAGPSRPTSSTAARIAAHLFSASCLVAIAYSLGASWLTDGLQGIGLLSYHDGTIATANDDVAIRLAIAEPLRTATMDLTYDPARVVVPEFWLVGRAAFCVGILGGFVAAVTWWLAHRRQRRWTVAASLTTLLFLGCVVLAIGLDRAAPAADIWWFDTGFLAFLAGIAAWIQACRNWRRLDVSAAPRT